MDMNITLATGHDCLCVYLGILIMQYADDISAGYSTADHKIDNPIKKYTPRSADSCTLIIYMLMKANLE